MDWVYLDNNATTRPTPEVAAAVAEAHDSLWANPSSVHRFGQQVRQRMELARASVAKLIGVKPREVVFTSGGTEANNLAIWGSLDTVRLGGRGAGAPSAGVAGEGPGAEAGRLITMATEHAAVRELGEAYEKQGGEVVWLPARPGGEVDLAALSEALRGVQGRVVLSVMWANNETGVVQPMEAIAEAVAAAREAAQAAGRGVRIVWHVDATQAVGKLPVDAAAAGVDLLTLAAHKFHGPKGVGALYVRRGTRLRPVQLGGPQETERRGGTENVAGVLGLGVAAEQAAAYLAEAGGRDAGRALRDRLEARALAGLRDAAVSGAEVNSGGAPRLWNTLNLGVRGVEAEAVLLGLSERGVCASAGAACSSGSLEPSPVLRAMGVEEPVAHGSVRFSLSRFTTEPEVDRAAEVWAQVVGRLSRVMPF
ncbi:MAG: cysteine desulfurase family protein [Planctomycetota bacterium]